MVQDVYNLNQNYNSSATLVSSNTASNNTIGTSGLEVSEENLSDEDIMVLQQILELLQEWRADEKWDMNRYSSIERTVNANEPKYEIPISVPGRIFNLRSDAAITINLNDITADNITLDAADPPISLWGLPKDSLIYKVYITTGATPANIKIITFG